MDWRDAAIDQLLTAQLIRPPYFERACQPPKPSWAMKGGIKCWEPRHLRQCGQPSSEAT